MGTASTASHNIRDAANDTARDAREGADEIRKAAADASGDIQDDLQALRDDFGKLAEQVREILSTRGNAAWQRAKSSIDDVVSDARDTGRDAAGAMRDVSDNFVDAIDESLKARPYTTLAIVAGLGFLFGATWWRR
jgi:ElaB/YqjD/DUF883 family membrane-anchored ribosome-binding protein